MHETSNPDSGGRDTPPIIELAEVGFAYPGAARPVLDNASLSLHPGQRLGLIGPNGSGKTTLLHVIMGLLPPDSGRILHHGRPVSTGKDFQTLRREVGLLFQNADDQLFSPTVLEDVAFGPLNLGQSPGDARKTALATLDRLGLAGFGNRLTHRLSGGEKKLVSLATVLAMEPAALLLDEPTAGLDQDTVARLGGILAGLGLAMVVISHDFDFLEDLSDEIMAMKDGRVLTGAAVPHRHVHVHDHGDLPHDHGADQAPDKG